MEQNGVDLTDEELKQVVGGITEYTKKELENLTTVEAGFSFKYDGQIYVQTEVELTSMLTGVPHCYTVYQGDNGGRLYVWTPIKHEDAE